MEMVSVSYNPIVDRVECAFCESWMTETASPKCLQFRIFDIQTHGIADQLEEELQKEVRQKNALIRRCSGVSHAVQEEGLEEHYEPGCVTFASGSGLTSGNTRV